MEPESQNLVRTLIAAFRDARKRGKRAKVLTALSFLAPRDLEPMVWSTMVIRILDGGEVTASILEDILENQSLRALDSALMVLRRPQD